MIFDKIRNSVIYSSLVLACLPFSGVVAGTNHTDLCMRYAPATVTMKARQVSPHVWYVQGEAGVATDNQGFISNAGFVTTGAGVVVFDALGSPSLACQLLDRIREVTGEPVVRVVVSHYHADHIYGLQVFADLGAEIVAPAGASEYLESEAAVERLDERRFSLDPWVNEHTRLVFPDQYLEEGMRFRLGDVDFLVTVVGTAHSNGDLSLLIEPDQVLFTGDIIFEGRIPFVGDANTGHWLDVLERMDLETITALIPGHGEAADNPNQVIRATRDYLGFLNRVMGEAVEEFVPFDEAYEAADWSAFEKLPAFDLANRRNAYQVYLYLEAESLDGE